MTFCNLPVTGELHNALNVSNGVFKIREFWFADAKDIENIPGVKKAVLILDSRYKAE